MSCAGSSQGYSICHLVVSVGQPVNSEAILPPQPLQLAALGLHLAELVVKPGRGAKEGGLSCPDWGKGVEGVGHGGVVEMDHVGGG